MLNGAAADKFENGAEEVSQERLITDLLNHNL